MNDMNQQYSAFLIERTIQERQEERALANALRASRSAAKPARRPSLVSLASRLLPWRQVMKLRPSLPIRRSKGAAV